MAVLLHEGDVCMRTVEQKRWGNEKRRRIYGGDGGRIVRIKDRGGGGAMIVSEMRKSREHRRLVV